MSEPVLSLPVRRLRLKLAIWPQRPRIALFSADSWTWRSRSSFPQPSYGRFEALLISHLLEFVANPGKSHLSSPGCTPEYYGACRGGRLALVPVRICRANFQALKFVKICLPQVNPLSFARESQTRRAPHPDET